MSTEMSSNNTMSLKRGELIEFDNGNVARFLYMLDEDTVAFVHPWDAEDPGLVLVQYVHRAPPGAIPTTAEQWGSTTKTPWPCAEPGPSPCVTARARGTNT